jgi:O-antigen/teichoic acid export membrane protein
MLLIKTAMVRVTKLSLLLAAPISVVFLIMGENFISLWVGNDYGERTVLVLSILTIGSSVAIGHLAINSILYGLSRHNIIAYVRIAEAAVNIILTVMFIKYWGIVGVALGMAVSHILFMAIVLPVLTCIKIFLPIWDYMKESIILPLLSCIPFAICCYFVQKIVPATNLIMFFFSVASILPVYMVSAWFISFSNAEKQLYGRLISQYASKSMYFLMRKRS